MQPLKLKVPYFSQRDSVFKSQAARMCYSSTNAMLLEFLKPGVIKGKYPPDDNYLVRVNEFGDTVMAYAQIGALKSYGLQAEFSQSVTFEQIDSQLAKGIPVPIGILIHGHISNPGGGGHWILVIGKTDNAYIVHDPNGELDLINGGYVHANGDSRVYSKTNLSQRFLSNGYGWGIIAQKPTGAKVEVTPKESQFISQVTEIKIKVDGKDRTGLRRNGESYPPIDLLKPIYDYEYIKEGDFVDMKSKG